MKLIFTILGGIFVCLPFITSEPTFNKCDGSCEPWYECKSLSKLREEIIDQKNSGKKIEIYFRSLQCDYNRNTRTPYFCCMDKKEKEIEIDYNSLNVHPNRKLFVEDECGYGNYNPGSLSEYYNIAGILEIPWIALIKVRGRLISSGTVINNRYVLTSAQYARNLQEVIQEVKVVLGDYDLSSNPDCQKERNGKSTCIKSEVVGVEGIYPHQNFNEKDLTNNIALIRLNKELEFSQNISPVCLPFNNKIPLFNNLHDVYGHGVSIARGSETNVTTRTTVKIVDKFECEKLYQRSNSPRKIDDTLLCVRPNKMPPFCSPDDGGAMSHTFGYIHHQLGVASFYNTACSLELPLVYTKVSHYLKWILDTIRK
ncbi:serine protease grass-like [Leptopilina heterotoma]|uniref:serine protease grass-like n=1 Tax=Leptopilina heterotoma TaxID=63436 RepID=UPI001CA812F5|nr:serine protease grass-like [Leptopilina heterotoma]